MEELDALERVMLANLLDGRTPRRRSQTPHAPRAQGQQSQSRQPVRHQPRPAQARPQAAGRPVVPAQAAPPAVDRRAHRMLDIGRVIKQIDPRTTPEQRRELAAAWAHLDLTADQVQSWLTAGVLPDQHRLVRDCLERGLRPEDVKQRIDGVRVVERLRTEGADAVLALLRRRRMAASA